MVVLIDTNVILDALINRDPFAQTARDILKKCAETEFSGFFAGHTIPDIFYILRKDYTAAKRKDMLLGICDTLDVVGFDRIKLINALTNEDFDDLEDCLQVECAKAAGAEYIITRNTNDFTGSPIPAILPDEFLKKLDGNLF